MKYLWIILTVLALLFSTNAHADVRSHHKSHRHTRPFQTGVASWYGARERGRRTANGERFNPNAMTCAHRTLPMGTVVRVTNTENGKTVVVRVNDRGPYVGHRVIDLSDHAARILAFRKEGLATVKIVIIRLPHQLEYAQK